MKKRLLTIIALSLPMLASAQEAVEIKTVKVADAIWMLMGNGGNIGVSAGADGLFMIDDQYPAMSGNIRQALQTLHDQPPRFIINTHWHGDHTGGNESFGNSGTVIVAHENVRKRMSTDQFIEALNWKVPPSPAAALPMVTFTDAVKFHLNGDEVRVFHLPPAHTDGDSVVHFQNANVIHTGDLFFNGLYPFIDVSSGGWVKGMIAAADQILSMADEDTRIIPGHGPLARKADLEAFRQMLLAVHTRIAAAVRDGKTLAQVQAMKPTADYDEKWGGGFLKPEQFTAIVYTSVTKSR
ncbi:MAG: MBL fold metallo-hydrolase [Panacagrimonas sp.]